LIWLKSGAPRQD